MKKKVLNVGGNTKTIPLPRQYADFEHVLLDIDPKGQPDILCDARELRTLQPAQFDAIYCSHNLEHYFRHEIPQVLDGFMHVLKDDGFAHIRVPDLHETMRVMIERDMDIEEVMYQSYAGPITFLDALYGYTKEIAQSGRDYYAHKTGFTRRSLASALQRAGFVKTFTSTGDFEIKVLAFKNMPGKAARALFNLIDD